MIWWRPPARYRDWWDTKLGHDWQVTETIGRLWARHLVPFPAPIEANDRDHIKW